MNKNIYKNYLITKKKGALCIFSLSDIKTNWLIRIKFKKSFKINY